MSAPQLAKGARVRAVDPEDKRVSHLVVNGEPWFNNADGQWYYPIEDRSTGEQGDMTDADLASGDITTEQDPT